MTEAKVILISERFPPKDVPVLCVFRDNVCATAIYHAAKQNGEEFEGEPYDPMIDWWELCGDLRYQFTEESAPSKYCPVPIAWIDGWFKYS